MPIPRRRRVAAALLAALVADAGVALVTMPHAGAARTRAHAESSAAKKKAAATLTILEPGVSVRRKGEDEFEPAKDGQKLFVGDTIKTDDTGFAEIDYTAKGDTYTRLDVNTEFTLVSITDDEGNRKVNGSVDVGRSWNRATELSESETYEQEGAGATAAVVGTVFMVDCQFEVGDDGLQHIVCDFISILHQLRIRTVDGEVQLLEPLQECDATEIDDTDSDLCEEPGDVDLAALLADAFVAKNYFLDAAAGFEVPPVSFTGQVTVENGQVTSFTPTPPTPPGGGTPASVLDPTNPIGCFDGCNQSQVLGNELPEGFEAGNEIVTTSNNRVYFVANLTVDPTGLFIVFDSLPTVGAVWYVCPVECEIEVDLSENFVFDANSEFFYDGDAAFGSSSFSFHIENDSGDNLGSSGDVPVTVEFVGEAAAPQESTTTSTTTEEPTTQTTETTTAPDAAPEG